MAVDYNETDDSRLVELYRSGDEQAFNELFNRYRDRLWRIIWFYTGDVDACQDVLNEVFMRVVRHSATYNSKRNFSAWIYRIAVNTGKNHLARREREKSIIEREKLRLQVKPPYHITPEEELVTESERAALEDAINNLGEKFKDVFILRYDQNMQYADIGKVLGCSERTAKWRMKRALERIRDYLNSKGML